MILVHGTTRARAERIVREGPRTDFLEPGGLDPAEGFSTCVESGPFPFGTPEDYARGKAREFPEEGGPVILILEVSDEIVELAASSWFPLSQGLVQFDPGSGFEALISDWPLIAQSARIRSVT